MGFAMTQISRRRTDKLCDLVRVLEFGAVDLDHRPRIAEEHLRCYFDDPRLSRARWAKKEQITDWAPPCLQAGTKHAVQVNDRLHGFVLPNNLLAQRSEERRVGKECRSRWSPYH